VEYVLSESGAVTKVALHGRLDAPSVDRIEAGLLASIVAGDRSAMVDLAGVTFVSSVGIRMLLGATEALRQRRARLVLYGAQPLVAESLNLVIKQLIPLVDTESQARALLDA
jgi:anti-sigma B factor antagonist